MCFNLFRASCILFVVKGFKNKNARRPHEQRGSCFARDPWAPARHARHVVCTTKSTLHRTSWSCERGTPSLRGRPPPQNALSNRVGRTRAMTCRSPASQVSKCANQRNPKEQKKAAGPNTYPSSKKREVLRKAQPATKCPHEERQPRTWQRG